MTAQRALVVLIVVLTCGVAWDLAEGQDEAGELSSVMQLGDVAFPHEMHFDDLELECESCHHETRAATLRVPHEQYFAEVWSNCVLCHTAGTGAPTPIKCASCHPATPADIADETLSAKVVIHRSCWQCHEVGRGVEASRSCGSCHSGRGRPSESEGAEERER